ncbi:EAL domain-containing protein [Ideonella sp. DXS22W]|uniref:EAL domain-containing protein n=1 Tax=Pseudaquabacterium inlustre TaxID=2984192 RepID=A0ABU9CHY8_9BURK
MAFPDATDPSPAGDAALPSALSALGAGVTERTPAGRACEPLWRRLQRRVADLSVAQKLLLIYLLDLCAVIFISHILVREKYIAIDFARKELQGVAYVEALQPLMVASLAPLPKADARARMADAVLQADALHGQDMGATAQATAWADALRAPPPAAVARPLTAIPPAQALLTRVVNQSNLVLDPALDSYYTMSLAMLRYPQVLDLLTRTLQLLQAQPSGSVQSREAQAQLLVLQGAIVVLAADLRSDFDQAVQAGGPELQQALTPSQDQILDLVSRAELLITHAVNDGVDARDRGELIRLREDAPQTVLQAWSQVTRALSGLLQRRVDADFHRMRVHLGTAAVLLLAILGAVFWMARRITRPVQALVRLADEVRVSGDASLRLQWDSGDELGRLGRAFNDMLGEMAEQRRVQAELAGAARAAEAQRQLLEHTPVPLLVTSVPEHRVLHANAQAARWLPPGQHNPWARCLSADARRQFFQTLSDLDVVREQEVCWRTAGVEHWVLLSARRFDYQGQPAVLTTITPIGTLKQAEQRLELWAKVFEASSEGMVLLDAQRRVLSANQAFCRVGGVDELGRPALASVRLGPQALADVPAVWQEAERRGWWRGEVSLHAPDDSAAEGLPALAVVTAVRHREGALTHFILTCMDISDRKNAEESVRYLAHHDVLTGLPNRTVAEQRLREAMAQAAATGESMALLFIDLDRFKNINDSLGHHVGDAVLRTVSQRLLQAVRHGDTVSRFGGDEFVVLLHAVSDPAEAHHVAERLAATLREPIGVDGIDLICSCSVGVAMFPGEASTINELMRHADAAMYEAKADGRDRIQFFNRDVNGRVQQRLRLEMHLRQAIEQGELSLVYQPQVDGHSRRLQTVEALLRWQSQELGSVSPAEFIPVAEESRLIVPIGEWVIEQVCAQLADWRTRGVPIDSVAINLSAVQLDDDQLPAALHRSMARHGVSASALELELTESTLMERGSVQRFGQLQALRELGVRLSIDDFGTGYSSLSYLSRLPMGKLKLDRELVRHVLQEPRDLKIAHAVISLAHGLDMRVVAEGVEDEALLVRLVELGCDTIQGYHTGRPMTPALLEAWVQSSQTAPVPSAA